MCLLALVACTPPTGRDATDAKPDAETQAAIESVENGPPPPPALNAPAPASCDTPAVPVALGSEVQGELQATNAGYPANARYYCFAIPAGANQVTLALTGMTADLDLYVGHGAISSVQGVDLTAGETYEWKSNAFGTADEFVTIYQPQAGVYYAEIVSYESQYSPYRFATR
jgi:hypothetical protein